MGVVLREYLNTICDIKNRTHLIQLDFFFLIYSLRVINGKLISNHGIYIAYILGKYGPVYHPLG